MQTVKVIHTLEKPYDRLYAGIYIQHPVDGVLDKNGTQLRALHGEVGLREVPNEVISQCIRRMFNLCPGVSRIEYTTPRHTVITITSDKTQEEIRKLLTEVGSYAV
jgi:hypothetical protein